MNDWKKTKALVIKFKRANIKLTPAEIKLIEYLRQKNQESK